MSRNIHHALLGLCSLALLLTAACGPVSTITAPGGFVMLEEEQLPYGVAHKAISADGAVVVVREQDNEPRGTLAFWSEALQREVTQGRGYELLEATDVRTTGGIQGRRMQFKGAHNETVYRYDVAVFLLDDSIVTVEVATPEASWEQHAGEFEATLLSLRPD